MHTQVLFKSDGTGVNKAIVTDEPDFLAFFTDFSLGSFFSQLGINQVRELC